MQSLINKTGGCGSFRIEQFHTHKETQSQIFKTQKISLLDQIHMLKNLHQSFCCCQLITILRNNDSHTMVYFQEENIYKLNKNSQMVMKSYTQIVEGILKLLKSCLIYIRTGLYILQITTTLSKVIFSFHIMIGERFIKCDLQKEFLDISDELKQQMEIEKDYLIQIQMELYLFFKKISFQNALNNSNEREDILKGCLSGIIGSIIQMKPNAELLESLFQRACLLHKMYACRKIENNMKLGYFKNVKQQNLKEILLQTQAIHENLVQNSNNWRNHQLWIQMIGKILIFNPLLTKTKIISAYQLFRYWNPVNLNMEGVSEQRITNLNEPFQRLSNHLTQLTLKQRITLTKQTNFRRLFQSMGKLYITQNFLLYEQNQNIFESYLKCKLQVGKKNENILVVDQIQKFLDFIISNKLFAQVQENCELGQVVKILEILRKTILSLMRGYYHIQFKFKKFYLKLKENTLNFIKIIRLNSRKTNCQIKLLNTIIYNN